jgi:hypothetical protein
MPLKTPDEIERRHVPTIARMRYGNTPDLAKLTDEAVALASVADSAQVNAKRTLDYVKRLRADPTQQEAKRTMDEMRFARVGLDAVDRRYATAIEDANKRLEGLMDALEAATAPSSNPGQALVEAEIRGRLAAMSDADAMQAINADPAVRKAVVSAPRLLSGMAEERWNRLWREHLEHAEPETFAKYTDLTAAIESAKTARAAIHEEARQLIDFERGELIEKARVGAAE